MHLFVQSKLWDTFLKSTILLLSFFVNSYLDFIICNQNYQRLHHSRISRTRVGFDNWNFIIYPPTDDYLKKILILLFGTPRQLVLLRYVNWLQCLQLLLDLWTQFANILRYWKTRMKFMDCVAQMETSTSFDFHSKSLFSPISGKGTVSIDFLKNIQEI